VRDIDKMTAMQFPVFARGRCVYDSLHRQRVIDVDVPVEIDGVTFNSGDFIIADGDGIVVIPRKAEVDVLRRAWEKVHAENIVRDEIKNGMKAVAAFKKYGVL
jgi:4-hydroxy-4-methyl-2-oxoglutarate aldolase